MPLTFNFHGLSSTLSGSNFQCHIGEIDLVIADAGSSDGTQEIAREYGATLVENPLKTGEAGKSAGIAASSGDLIALVDSDNILDDARWLEKMIRPFDDPEIVAAEPLFYTRRDTDPALTRYFSMLGMNDPICLFLGNYDRFSMVTGKWTELPTIGANGFVFRRSLIESVNWSPYSFDIDVLAEAIDAGHRHATWTQVA